MKVVLAVGALRADVIGLIPNTDDEVVFINDWLHRREPGQYKPSGFKVTHFDRYARTPLGVTLYQVEAGKATQ